MIDKRVETISDAVAGIADGAVILSSGFGDAGAPIELLEAIAKTNVSNLTIVSNNADEGDMAWPHL